ncbi:MAG: molybdopterin-dependent oxidoreductase [Chloroflexi bacterium]|nr:molybdopterin-dependent oxidoreductase [Chloroflexota bacterium]
MEKEPVNITGSPQTNTPPGAPPLPRSQMETKGDSESGWIPTVCTICTRGPDLIRFRRVGDVVTNIEGNGEGPGFQELTRNQGRICPRPYSYIEKLYSPNRIKSPLKRTNPKKGRGVDPKWVPISWDEALDIVAGKLKEVRDKDPNGVCTCTDIYGTDGSKGTLLAFFAAWGPFRDIRSGAGIRCGIGAHNFTNNIHGGFRCFPDMTMCRYLLVFGSNLVASGAVAGNLLLPDMKKVVIDPVYSATAAKADEWVPVKPGTDGAFMLAMINFIIYELDVYDREFLKNMTNSPYLIGPDGYFVRDGTTGKVLVWDASGGRAKAHDDPSVEDCALLGNYLAEGVECRPAFQALKDHVKQYTPEWAADITQVSAATIRRLAREFIENARIGSTVQIGGLSFPHRPVDVMIGRPLEAGMHCYQHYLSQHILVALAGALEVPGGHDGGNADVSRYGIGMIPGDDGMIKIDSHEFTWPPVSWDCAETLTPYTRVWGRPGHLFYRNLVSPPPGLPLPPPPQVYIKYRQNPVTSLGEPDLVIEALKKIPFIVSIAIVEDETTQLADVVLPDHMELERSELVPTDTRLVTGKRWKGTILRQRVVPPLHNTMDIGDIFTELADRIGFLPEYNAAINRVFALLPADRLETDRKYRWEDIVERHCRAATNGEHDIEWFKTNSAIIDNVPVESQYGVYLAMKRLKLRYPLPYLEHVKKTGEALARNLAGVGVDWWKTDEFVALPVWVPPAIDNVPPEYDFYVTTCRVLQFINGTNVDSSWLTEVARLIPGQHGIVMNARAAAARGIREGDEICLESPFGKVKGQATLIQGIRPDTILLAGQFGRWSMPVAKDNGWPNQTELVPLRYEWTDPVTGAMQGQVIRAKVYKVKV